MKNVFLFDVAPLSLGIKTLGGGKPVNVDFELLYKKYSHLFSGSMSDTYLIREFKE